MQRCLRELLDDAAWLVVSTCRPARPQSLARLETTSLNDLGICSLDWEIACDGAEMGRLVIVRGSERGLAVATTSFGEEDGLCRTTDLVR